MSILPKAHHFINIIQPYQLGRSTEKLATDLGIMPNDIVRLAANENCLGMSSAAQTAIQDFLKNGARYPEVAVLQKAIARHHNVSPAQVIPGNGSCEVLELVARSFLNPGHSSVYPQQSFVMYKLASLYMGATGIAVPSTADWQDDLSGLLAAIRPDTQVVWMSNVNNPTGALNSYSDLKDFIGEVPRQVVIVLDEAYAEYLPPPQQANTLDWIEEFPNLVVTRTFSKIHGLAGLRVGYGVASEPIADTINRMRGPYNCNSLGIVAALAALGDQTHVERSRIFNQRSVRRLSEGLAKLGYRTLPAWGNFVTFEVEDALQTRQQLLRRGIVVLPLNGYTMPHHVRVSAGLAQENERFLQILPHYAKEPSALQRLPSRF